MQNDPTAAAESIEFGILVPNHGQAMMAPPPPPAGYELISVIRAVSLAGIPGYWASLAYHQRDGAYGLLLYWPLSWRQTTHHAFYPTEDACHLLSLYGADFLHEASQGTVDRSGSWCSVAHQREVSDEME